MKYNWFPFLRNIAKVFFNQFCQNLYSIVVIILNILQLNILHSYLGVHNEGGLSSS